MNTPANDELVHLRSWEMLPWIANGRATDTERRFVDEHLRDCERCRVELAFQHQLIMAMQPDENIDCDVEQGLKNLWQRFDEAEKPPGVVRSSPVSTGSRRMTALVYGLAALVLLQAGGLYVFVMRNAHDDRSASYRTLSQLDTAANSATIRLVVDSNVTVGQLQTLLVSLDLQIVGGPSKMGVYSLAPVHGHGNVSEQIAALRAATGVRFAEPVGGADNSP